MMSSSAAIVIGKEENGMEMYSRSSSDFLRIELAFRSFDQKSCSILWRFFSVLLLKKANIMMKTIKLVKNGSFIV